MTNSIKSDETTAGITRTIECSFQAERTRSAVSPTEYAMKGYPSLAMMPLLSIMYLVPVKQDKYVRILSKNRRKNSNVLPCSAE
jgi:hypothetical protein